MPRRERPLDPGDGVLLRFAADLRQLRRAAGNPTYRVLARQVHYSVATLSEAAAGRKLPSLAVTLAYVRACGGDVDEWEQRWRMAAAELASGPDAGAPGGPADDPGRDAPYVGLAAFEVGDAYRFFGRERLLDELAARLSRQRFVPVIGASGAGKSSLLRAGLLARERTRAGGRPTLLCTPGASPLRECARALAGLGGDSPETVRTELARGPEGLHRMAVAAVAGSGTELLFVVDQFEEIFTLCRDEDERARFVGLLAHAVRTPDSRCRVVLGLRADFFAHCTDDPQLAPLFNDAPLIVGPMTADELRRAVTEPAGRAGYSVETALLVTLVAQANGQVGVLPLLSHALLQTWYRRRGNALTLAGFQAAGGIDGALAHTAETLYRALPADQQRLVRHLLLQLTAPGEGTADTKRRLHREEVGSDPDSVAVLTRLAAARLITLDRESVEITHEALIQCWPRLRGWLAEDRDGRRVHQDLAAAARDWDAHGRDPGYLYRGVRLATAHSWARAAEPRLSARESRFLAAGVAARDAEQIAADRRNRRLRVLAATLGVLTALAVTTSGMAVRAEQAATRQRDDATSQRVAGASLALRTTRPALAAQLALAAYRLSPTPEARGALLSTFATPYAAEIDGANPVESVAFSPDGRTLAVGDGREVRLWDTTDPQRPRPSGTLTGSSGAVDAVMFSPDGRTIAAADDGAVLRWTLPESVPQAFSPKRDGLRGGSVAFSPDGRTIATHTRPLVFSPRGDLLAVTGPGDAVRVHRAAGPAGVPPPAPELVSLADRAGPVNGVAFTPDGGAVATAGDDGLIRIWDVAEPRQPRPRAVLAGHTDAVRAIAFSPDGRTLVSGGADATVRIWATADVWHPRQVASLSGHVAAVNSVTFSPDGRTIVTGGSDHVTRLWRLPGPWLLGHASSVYAVAISPDGRRLASGSYDRTVRLWDLDPSGQPREAGRLLGHAAAVNSVAFSPDGGMLASAGHDRTVRLWRQAGPRPPDTPVRSLAHPASVEELAFDPRGGLLATAGQDGVLRLWDVTTAGVGTPIAVLKGHAGAVESVAFRTDGRLLATGGADRTVRLWNLTNRSAPVAGAVLTGHADTVKALAFSPSGRTLASAGEDREVRLWDVADPRATAHRGTLSGHTDGVNAVAFAAGGVLVTASSDRTVRLWDATDPRRTAELGTLTGHAKPVDALAVAPDGHTLLTGSEDWTGLLWDVDPQEVARKVCAMVPAPVSRSEWERYFPDHAYHSPCPVGGPG
ncbi:hypothetical protein [Plantactinospora sp. CA-290183]|uniref:nSTAND1 domain-containing NTPase n=1 Tax=Plantactinospora sp. CA-290183 TaxID=3240006 RepID=UPI003D8A8AA0